MFRNPPVASAVRLPTYLGLVALAFLCTGLLIADLFLQYREKLLAQAENDAMNLARVLDERLAQTFKRLDADLLRIRRDLGVAEMVQGLAGRYREGWARRLAGIKFNFPEVSNVFVFDAEGDLLYTSNPEIRQLNVSQRGHFVRLRDDSTLDLVFSEVITARSTGLHTVAVARAVRSPEGHFLGMVSALLDLQDLKHLFGFLQIGEQGVIMIRSNDEGRLVLRHPERLQDINKGVDSPITQRIKAGELWGSVRFLSPIDGISRIWSFRALEAYPFNVTVAFAEDEVLASWRQKVLFSALFFMLLSTLLAATAYRALNSERRRQRVFAELLESRNALKENQRQLNEAVRLHDAIEASITESIWLLTAEGRVVTGNPTATGRLGRTLAMVQGQDVFSLFPEEIREARRQALLATVASKEKQVLADQRAGRDFLNAFYPVLDAQGHCDHVVVVATDITQQKAHEQALAESRKRLSNIIEATLTGTWEWNVQSGALTVNARWAEIVGYTLEELEPVNLDTWVALAHPDDLEHSGTLLAQHFAGELAYYDFETRMKHREGHWVWVHDRGKVIEWSADGQPLRMSGTHQEITSRKLLEAELSDYRHHLEQLVERRTADLEIAKEAAEAASRAKTAFLSMASHELRTPMNGVMGTIGLAMRKTRDPVLLDYLNKADRASRQLLGIINNVLDISRIESARLTLASTVFSLDEIRGHVLDAIESIAETKHLALVYPEEHPLAAYRFIGDPPRLAQILINLVGNALKFTQMGQVVVLITEVPCETEAAARLRFEVRDTGIGIHKADLGRIFEPFEQGDASVTRKHGGTGLGLALCRKLVEAMSGQIGVESEVGRGSCFWFEIELGRLSDTAESGTAANVPAVHESAGDTLRTRHHGASVLVVEDEPLSQEIIRAILEEVGLNAFTVSDGLEAVDFARSGVFDLILMDINMPRMSGIEACCEIRRLPTHASTPIIALTANAFAEDRHACIRAGMNDHVGKPVMPEVLYQALLRWLDLSHHRARP